jgi:sulfoxide reductase heme-binding subunit YedZ
MIKKIDWLRIAVHLGAWITLAVMAIHFFTNTLTVNPILTLERQTGKTALIFLILSLACTPLTSILGWKSLHKRRKALGLYGFMFAAIHLLIYVGLDFGFKITRILQAVIYTVYLWFGMVAFILLLALAITSFKKIKKELEAPAPPCLHHFSPCGRAFLFITERELFTSAGQHQGPFHLWLHRTLSVDLANSGD